MQLTVTGVQGNGFTQVTVEHKMQQIAFSTKAYAKVKLPDQQRVFKEFNGFLNSSFVSEEDKDHIWNCYSRIRDILDMPLDSMRVAMSLRYYIRELYERLSMNDMRRWLMTVGNLHIPVEVEKKITAESRYNKVDQTYLEHEYINLATVALAVRPMIPIWGEYIEAGTENELHKENEVVGLISDCEIAHWPVGEKGPHGEDVDTAFEKLAGYVRFCVEAEATTLGQLWRGMSSVEVPVHLQSKVLVRRLTIVPLDDPTSHSIVANTYRYVKSNLNPAERTTADRVNEKRPESGGDDDDKTSFIEAHKTKHRVSPGDIEAFNVDALNVLKLARKVDPTIDLGKLKLCVDAISNVASTPIYPHQIKLAQWVMARSFPARAFYHINKVAVNNMLAAAQALIWHWGFKDIAVFMQVDLVTYGDYQSQNQLSQPRSNARIPIKYKEDMIRLFPHQKAPQYMNNGTALKTDNMAGIAINNVNASIHSSHWVYRGPDQLFKDAGQVSGTNVLIVPPTIKATITELVIHLGNLNK
jgi:hypothetical protein